MVVMSQGVVTGAIGVAQWLSILTVLSGCVVGGGFD